MSPLLALKIGTYHAENRIGGDLDCGCRAYSDSLVVTWETATHGMAHLKTPFTQEDLSA